MPRVVAIHQPNYLPWLGYFEKIAAADAFVFLDDVQFSKNSYTNRVKIMGPSGPKWLTVPIDVSLGDTIDEVATAREEWPDEHRDMLRNYYRNASEFPGVFGDLDQWFDEVPARHLSKTNRHLIQRIAARVGLECDFVTSSDLDLPEGVSGDDRLVAVVASLAPGGTYLSGSGARSYQDGSKFENAGLRLRYSEFEHPRYDQTDEDFVAGLSVVDAAFHLGWSGVGELLQVRAR